MPIPRLSVAAASLYAALAWSHAPLAIPGDAPSPSAAPAHVAGAQPIKGRVTGSVQETLLASPATYRLVVTASGTISLGGAARTTWELPEVTLDLASSVMRLKHASWSGSLSVANGDRLNGRYTFRSTELRLAANGDFTAVADIAITGGTGRFAGSTGHCVSNVRGNVHARTVTVDFAGELTTAGK